MKRPGDSEVHTSEFWRNSSEIWKKAQNLAKNRFSPVLMYCSIPIQLWAASTVPHAIGGDESDKSKDKDHEVATLEDEDNREVEVFDSAHIPCWWQGRQYAPGCWNDWPNFGLGHFSRYLLQQPWWWWIHFRGGGGKVEDQGTSEVDTAEAENQETHKMDPSSWATCNSEMFSKLCCDAEMDSQRMVPKIGCNMPMASVMSSETNCDTLDPAGNILVHISEFLILFHPPPVCKRGRSKFQGRQKASKDAFNNNFRVWLGLGTLETLGTHPPIAKYGTKKQLAKWSGSLDWIKLYMNVLNDLKQDCALKGTTEMEQYPSLWKVTVLLAMPLWLLMWVSFTTSQKEGLFMTEWAICFIFC